MEENQKQFIESDGEFVYLMIKVRFTDNRNKIGNNNIQMNEVKMNMATNKDLFMYFHQVILLLRQGSSKAKDNHQSKAHPSKGGKERYLIFYIMIDSGIRED